MDSILTTNSTQLGIDVGGSSVKAAGIVDGRVTWRGQSGRYADPTPASLARAVAEAIGERAPDPAAVGLCVPGILTPDGSAIELSVNLPKLNGVPLAGVVADALGRPTPRLRVLNDSTASAYDLYLGRGLAGRLFLMVLGTGVGVAVMDAAGPLRVDGDSPGHFGQMDVSIEGHPVVGPDGGAGSLEGYVGAAALAAAYGTGPDALAGVKPADPAFRAIVRSIRIAHALYRPQHVVLAGGVGIRLAHAVDEMKAATNRQLTKIARPGWTLGLGEHDFHAAAGAARAAGL
ncbi:MAG: hypothetical protein JWO31_1890 [Phycisphaerales bacterium]|nr:hypothetical protein [Phycisphaerales bacterium]